MLGMYLPGRGVNQNTYLANYKLINEISSKRGGLDLRCCPKNPRSGYLGRAAMSLVAEMGALP